MTGRLERDGSLALSPTECISLELPGAWFEDPLHLSPHQPLCLRSGERGALQVERATSVPVLRAARAVLDPLTFAGRFGADSSQFRLSLPPVHLVYEVGTVTGTEANGNDQQLGLLTQVFEDFHFETIVIALNGDVFGDVQASIHLGGANPTFKDGFPMEFNLNAGAQFGDLIRGGSVGFGIADRVVAKMREKEQARKSK